MRNIRLPVWVMVAAFLFSALDFVYHYAQLPPRVASHFDGHGRPDGWSTKLQFLSLAVGTLLLATVILAPISVVARFAPRGLINLPNKEYWMAPEREAETRRAIAQWGLWFTTATLWLLALLFHETMAANLRQPPQLQSMWWLFGGYLAVTLYLVMNLTVRFWRKP